MVEIKDLPSAVLFCCTMNTIRSPMAEAILKRLYPRSIFVDSVGVHCGEPDGFAIAAMDEIGLDMTRHRAKTFNDLEDTSFDLIISLSPEAQHKAVDLTRHMSCDVEYWQTLDPSFIEGNRDSRMDAYRAVRDGLFERIRQRFMRSPIE